MKKILSIDQIRQADKYTIDNEPITSCDLMERAATACYEWIRQNLPTYKCVRIFCGMGNNGGDGLVIARKLASEGVDVSVYSVEHSEHPSADFQVNLERLRQQRMAKLYTVTDASDFPTVDPRDLIVDALLGSGLTKPTEGLLKEIIILMNQTRSFVLAIDIPSGLFCDKSTDGRSDSIVQANHTLTFEVPRMGFLFSENERFIGNWTLIPIGLHPDLIRDCETSSFLLEESDIISILKPRLRFSHKGTFGHGLLISGSYGKMGAAVLGTRAALRAGCGLVTTCIPKKGYEILQSAVPEGMVLLDPEEEHFSTPPELSPFNAIAVGPGIDKHPQTANALKLLIQNTRLPLILDADALNILSDKKTWLSFLPPHSILTPHLKEFERLTHRTSDSFERLEIQKEFSRVNNVFTILKGAFSCITFPDGRCFFNTTGNPGMATAGSGDVLTGILLGLMSQHYSPAQTCLLGTYLHGLAGDLAMESMGEEALLAGDIIDHLSTAYLQLKQDTY